MSFFKDLKEDIAQSVNELTETFDEEQGAEDIVVEDFSSDAPVPDEFDGIEEPALMFTKPVAQPIPEDAPSVVPDFTDADESAVADALKIAEEKIAASASLETEPELEIPDIEPAVPEPEMPAMDLTIEEPVSEPVIPEVQAVPEMAVPDQPEPSPAVAQETEIPVTPEATPEIEIPVEMPVVEDVNTMSLDTEGMTMSAESMEDLEMSTDEVTVITKGTTINGGIKSDTSLVVKGTIEGDVECAGKLTITGRVAGNTNASEIYVNTPRLEGDLHSQGIVKIDVGTVVIGGINSASVVVAGAVKGNIEVNGPVIIDSTAVVKGDIKAKSIQINSGAVIDGHCSLQFADVDLDTFFE